MPQAADAVTGSRAELPATAKMREKETRRHTGCRFFLLSFFFLDLGLVAH